MLKHKKLFLFIMIIAAAAQGCKFNKLKKSNDPDKKLEAAKDYYENEKYSKALLLLEDIALVTRGTPEGEEVLYKLAYSNYHVKDYILAGYYFRKYNEYYPEGKYSEDAGYMSAYCYYLDAPKPSLDQNETYIALQAFETFISRFPKSDKIEECNKHVDELRFKLEKKSYENAKLYHDLRYYRAAVISLKNSLRSYPDSEFKEEALFYIVKSSYLFAKNSVRSKQKERYQSVIKEYQRLEYKFPKSEFLPDAKKMKEKAEAVVEEIKQSEKGSSVAEK